MSTNPPPRLELVRKVRDPCIGDGYVRLSAVAASVVDTPYFQRLRYLNQLGVAHHVYPSATHTRFAHSLGVAHRARELLVTIADRQPELQITARELLVIELAGLCHDIGHGPFSHSFEAEVVGKMERLGEIPHANWCHEDMSAKIFDLLCQEFHVEITDDERDRVKDLMCAGHGSQRLASWSKNREFMFDIVSNQRSGLDVDRLDYLIRDNAACDALICANFASMLDSVRVVGSEICFRCSPTTVAAVYIARLQMHEHVYQHPVLKGIEYMCTDALFCAREELGLAAALRDPKKYCSLDDRVLLWLQNGFPFVKNENTYDGASPLGPESAGCAEAARILDRLSLRDLYKYCGSVEIPAASKDNLKNLTTELLATCWNSMIPTQQPAFDDSQATLKNGNRVILNAEDLRVNKFTIAWTKGGTNPLKAVGFWESEKDRQPIRRELAKFLPGEFESREARVYLARACDTPEEKGAYMAAARAALQAWNAIYVRSLSVRSPTKSHVTASARKRTLAEGEEASFRTNGNSLRTGEDPEALATQAVVSSAAGGFHDLASGVDNTVGSEALATTEPVIASAVGENASNHVAVGGDSKRVRRGLTYEKKMLV